MIYLDNAATSRFKPKSVIKAVVKELTNSANPGRSGHNDAISTLQRVYETRKKVLEFVNCSDGEVIFTASCTEALNLAIFGTARTGHVITTALEHNSTLRPLYKLEKEKLIKLTVIEPDSSGKINPKDIEKAINLDTYLVAVNNISNVTGAETDIAEIGKITSKKGALFLVDGAQSLGHKSIDMNKMGIDMLAAPGHKGIHGMQGSGFLVYSGRLRLNPIKYGGTGTNSESVYQPVAPPEAYESGTLNTPGIASIKAGIEWTMKHFDQIGKKLEHLSDIMLNGLKNIKGVTLYSNEPNSIAAFEINGYDSSRVCDIMNEKFNIALRSGLHCAPLMHNYLNTLDNGLVRASVGWNNSESDICKLLAAVEKIAAGANYDS
ncbi:MAG: aminotransferase class V-fold PLP-dependent enzyme [Christensenellales bacterium]|jgi:cysteine desulfurase/selenocysteine lyase